jgi:hypothetical protein
MLWRFFLSIDLIVEVFLQILKSAEKDGILQFEQCFVGGDFEGLSHALAQGALPQGYQGFRLKLETSLQKIRIGLGQGVQSIPACLMTESSPSRCMVLRTLVRMCGSIRRSEGPASLIFCSRRLSSSGTKCGAPHLVPLLPKPQLVRYLEASFVRDAMLPFDGDDWTDPLFDWSLDPCNSGEPLETLLLLNNWSGICWKLSYPMTSRTMSSLPACGVGKAVLMRIAIGKLATQRIGTNIESKILG